MARPAQITIHIDALRHNLKQIKKIAPHSRVLAMVKSNAYGHGLERIACALTEADALGVACIEEGRLLRQAGVKKPIVLMEGLFKEAELAEAARENFGLIVHHEMQVTMLEKTTLVLAFTVWLKIDTGMHRLGFPPHVVESIYQRLMQCRSIKKPFGLMTHFARSDFTDGSFTAKQIEIFQRTTAKLVGPRSLANSAGVLAWPSSHLDWVRPGIILYGASPFRGNRGEEFNLQPVMSLSSELIAIHHLAKGEQIGYGGEWTCPQDMLVGVVGIGYGDGYPQLMRPGTPMLVNGLRCPLIGRVSMDMLTVDLRSQREARVGDPVLLWGQGLPVEVIAENNATTVYELLTRITPPVRVKVAISGETYNSGLL